MPRFPHLVELFDESLIDQDNLEANLLCLLQEIDLTLRRFGQVPRLVEIRSTILLILHSMNVARQFQ
jgi:hypothetical protein